MDVSDLMKEKNKNIETEQMKISGNILKWEGTMLQISNISYVSTALLQTPTFPIVALLIVVVGVVLFSMSKLLAFLLLAIGIGWILFWLSNYQAAKEKIVLNICMNSGIILRIVFRNREFLNQVLNVIENIIKNGGTGGNTEVTVNIKDSHFEGNSQVLNNLLS